MERWNPSCHILSSRPHSILVCPPVPPFCVIPKKLMKTPFPLPSSNTYYSWIPPIADIYTHYPTLILRLLLVFNIFVALLPLYHRRDPLTDIPLTPTQRSLLGLDPTATPASPLTQYVTPPRYPRSSTPRSSTPGSRTGSPVSRKGSPRQASNSPFAPSPSPLWQNSIGGLKDSSRRHSYGSPSPLGPGLGGKDGSVFGTPRTPSPSVGKGASVGLNNRWLYERGRASPGRAIYS